MINKDILLKKLENAVQVRHIKSGRLYVAIAKVINTTNSIDGQVMILYGNNMGDAFVREIDEFCEKFELEE